MLHEKVLHVNKKKVDVAQKSILYLQKQDDAASKKVMNFFLQRRTIPLSKGNVNKIV